MKHTALTPLGAEVTGVRVGPLNTADTDELRTLLAEHGVIVLPDQDADDDDFLAFLRSFGETVFTVGETPVPGRPELNVISNVGRSTPPRSQFHVDTSYVRNPPAYTALRAVDVPAEGGQTLFSNQYRAFDSLPAMVREDLSERTVTHVVTGLDLDDDAETSAVHPLCATHPISGRTALYLSTPQRCAEVSGLSEEEAADTVASLLEHSTRPDNVLAHRWSPNDVVMWDNRCVMHKADHSGVVGDRVMHRGMVGG
ncbi:taurine catabolism dioxygenase [Williamsia sp. Leaf354]|jgi:taurine dioxygenase|uniref:TauD/TfdA dioxygenase family protein n=1 Tax=Williamsia sp. Leaf354 TaxID=1736349 RepID=UPI0006F25B33|nr:TauD/TfdA family dioxygenase [Williamsia sp. Leaf354]KQR97772.1 taurine catabolism dioxygenase [Williamsia sp. Leaf354]